MKRVCAAFLLLLAAATTARAGGRVSVLDLPPSARAAGMAMAGAADASDAANAFFNPANAAGARGVAYAPTYASWSGDVDYLADVIGVADTVGPVRACALVTDARLDFRVFDAEYAFVPFYNQASYMSATAAVAWAGRRGAFGAGMSFKWDTSERGTGEKFVDAGVRAAPPPIRRGRFRAECAAAWSVSNMGHDDGPPEPLSSTTNYTTTPAGERVRYGAAVRLAVARSQGSGELVAVAVDADALAAGGRNSGSAVGAEVTIAETLALRVGYGDRVVAARHAFAAGAGAGRRIGPFAFRLDYARVDTTDEALAANAFGAAFSLEF